MANTKITNPELFNLGDSTSATHLPVMTTTQRIAMVPTSPSPSLSIDYLVVAGGGAGGGFYRGGGGGAGELKESASSIALSTGSSYDVVVGAGGIGVLVGADNGSNGNNGGSSTFYSITSIGGGGGSPGDSSSGNTGSDGGSGGGAGGNWGGAAANGGSATGTGLGNNGGVGGPGSSAWQCGGGGGGAIQAGFNAGNSSSGTAGDGGAGKTYTAATSITGQAFSIAGGGGGANYTYGNITVGGIGGGAAGASGTSPYTNGPSAANNTGGGGGGGNYGTATGGTGGLGGSGIVILRYATADVASYTTTGITPTEDTTTISGQTILSFTTVGTGTINFTGALIPGTPPMTDGEMIFNSTTDKVEYWDGTKWYGITYEVVLNPCYNYTDPVTPYINFNLTDPLGTNASNNVLNISPATYTGQITQTVAPTTDATLGYKYFDEPTWDNGLQLSATPSLGSYGTIIAWVKFDSVTSGTQRHSIFGEGDSGNTSKWMVFRYNHGTGKIQWSCNGSTANRTCDVNKTLSNNVWYQIAFVKNNNSTAQFYLNGVSAGTTLYSVGSTTEWFNNISGNKWSWGSFQRGTYGVYDPMYAKSGSLKVFVDTALSASQILADYNYTKTCYGIS